MLEWASLRSRHEGHQGGDLPAEPRPLEPQPRRKSGIALALGGGAKGGDEGISEVNGVKLMARVLKGISPNDMKGLVDEGKKSVGSGVVVSPDGSTVAISGHKETRIYKINRQD